MNDRIYVVLLAGGSGTRMQSEVNKILLPLAGRSCIAHSAEAFRGFADGMVIVCRKEEYQIISQEVSGLKLPFPLLYASGGMTRQESVAHGLDALPEGEHAIVLIHDGARCLVSGDVIRNTIESVRQFGSGIASIPVTDTIKKTDEMNQICCTVSRDDLRAVQTPQGFWLDEIRAAHSCAANDGFQGTDDASLMEHAGFHVHLSAGSRQNLKLTTREDLKMAEALMNSPSDYPSLRVGLGYDVHQLCEGRKLILCGLEIPHSLGLQGHSDADVAIHALIDALLGAACLGDIGHLFPDTDERFKDISSMFLLSEVMNQLKTNGFRPSNADITIIAQKPKLASYIAQMTQNLAEAMSLPVSRVNVKATTTEHLGFEGRMEGISAQAVCLIQSIC